jgi:hypothetical protein
LTPRPISQLRFDSGTVLRTMKGYGSHDGENL